MPLFEKKPLLSKSELTQMVSDRLRGSKLAGETFVKLANLFIQLTVVKLRPSDAPRLGRPPGRKNNKTMTVEEREQTIGEIVKQLEAERKPEGE